MATYTSHKRIERDGVLVAFAGEVMAEAEAERRGLLGKPQAAEAEKVAAIKEPTVAELKVALAELSIDIPKGARQADLKALLASAQAAKAAEAEKVAAIKAAEGDTVNV